LCISKASFVDVPQSFATLLLTRRLLDDVGRRIGLIFCFSIAVLHNENAIISPATATFVQRWQIID